MINFFPSRAIALSVAGFSVHWYGIMYFLAFLLSYALVLRFQKFRSLTLTKDDVGTVLSWAIAGVIIGGRLGFVCFYEPTYFAAHPLEIFYVWNGGMSSHGGFIGVTLALLFILRKKHINILSFMDVAVIPIAIGLALGRFGNFLNWELYGRVTDLPWAMQIPGVEGLRHPTFFYAMIKDLWIAASCLVLLRSGKGKIGDPFALFLVMYGTLRFCIEYVREPTHDVLHLGTILLTRGQLLSIPLVLIGLLLAWRLHR